jgi:hypothetical protein
MKETRMERPGSAMLSDIRGCRYANSSGNPIADD